MKDAFKKFFCHKLYISNHNRIRDETPLKQILRSIISRKKFDHSLQQDNFFKIGPNNFSLSEKKD